MGKILSIIRYEYKMQMKNMAGWGIVLGVTVLALLDDFPSAGNLARLEFLGRPDYFVYRIMSFDALILVFGLMFLLAGRFPIDGKAGVKALMMAAPLRQGQYVLGKLLGGFFYVFSVLCVFLTLNTGIYFAAAPFAVKLTECLFPLVKTIVFSALPVSVFVSFCSIAAPAAVDLRLFYILAAGVFAFNAAYVGSAEGIPFYLITSGDLTRLIWVHPRWPQIDMGSVGANAAFLTGCGLFFGGTALLNRRLWRAE